MLTFHTINLWLDMHPTINKCYKFSALFILLHSTTENTDDFHYKHITLAGIHAKMKKPYILASYCKSQSVKSNERQRCTIYALQYAKKTCCPAKVMFNSEKITFLSYTCLKASVT